MQAIQRTELENDYYNFLLLSIYFYLKNNNYNLTADSLFKEVNLNNIFFFAQDIQEGTTEEEKIKKKFINYFYANTFFHQNQDSDFIADFWEEFWEIFAEKIKHSNTAVSPMETYLKKEKDNLKLTCKNYNLTFR